MTQPNSKSSITSTITRCQHRNRTGRQCKLPAVTGSPLCYSHNQAQRKTNAAADLASAILGDRSLFASASDINQALSAILIAAVHKRLSTREATAYAYICSLLIRSSALLAQEKLREEKASAQSASNETVDLWDQLNMPPSFMPAVRRRALEAQGKIPPSSEQRTEEPLPVAPPGAQTPAATQPLVGTHPVVGTHPLSGHSQ